MPIVLLLSALFRHSFSQIRTRERFDAERFYLQYQYDLSLAAAKASASGSGAAPSAGAAGAGAGAASSAPAFVFPARYHELVKEHGDPALVASDGKSKDGSSTLASRLLGERHVPLALDEVLPETDARGWRRCAALTLSASSAELSTLRVEKSVLPSTTVSALRKMVAAALKFPGGSDFVLAYRDGPVRARLAVAFLPLNLLLACVVSTLERAAGRAGRPIKAAVALPRALGR